MLSLFFFKYHKLHFPFLKANDLKTNEPKILHIKSNYYRPLLLITKYEIKTQFLLILVIINNDS